MKTKFLEKTEQLEWRVNTAAMLSEIVQHGGPGVSIMARPLQIFANILYEVGKRASELNDPELNKLMARLAIYAETDPYSDSYSEDITKRVLAFKK